MQWNDLLNGARPRASRLEDHRSPFERDYGRIVFSTPFKRLADKTQVFPLESNDSIRTRLTHTLEVSNLARGIAEAVGPILDRREPDWSFVKQRDLETIAATAALIHDLGNPPFGHAGEDSIREWFIRKVTESDFVAEFDKLTAQQKSDFIKFEGNAQSLRLVRKLHVLGESEGLNLTFGTYSACLKYTASSDRSDPKSSNHAHRKPGFFCSEETYVREIETRCPTMGARNPITFLVEAADDIVNATADLEDAVKRGVLRYGDIEQRLHREGCGVEIVRDTVPRILDPENTAYREFTDDERASAFRTATIAVLVESVTQAFDVHYDAIMSGQFLDDLIGASTQYQLHKVLEDMKREKIFPLSSILKLEITGLKIIGDLMDILWSGAAAYPALLGEKPKTKSFSGKAGLLFSDNYVRVFQKAAQSASKDEFYYRCLLLTDYVCGMTDGYAVRLHSELTDGRH